ncbi:MAG TPA: hypothetical protein VEZ90_05520 [Blastocatellia bacterium]|nr:hypothetical protein [Blastocatellia bacterium]
MSRKTGKSRLARFRSDFQAIGLILALWPLSGLGQPGSAKENGTVAERDGQHDFDFIFGFWKIHTRTRARGSNTWTDYNGVGSYKKIWDGRAILNEFETDGPSGHIEGLGLQTYNPRSHQWSLYWVDSGDGILGVPLIGEFKEGQGQFYAQDNIDGQAMYVRYIWSEIAKSSAHFEESLSDDGGKTWEAIWVSDMVRTPDSSGQGPGDRPLAAPANATSGAASIDNSGRRDFDPLAGRWNYHLKRRLNPLTGSTNWIELSGTGVCYKVWNGRAQLDTIEVDGPNTHIEGLTLRVFNPQSHQWRLYWANAKDGIVAAPQIGQFNNGHGEFYGQGLLNGKIILVRFDWTDLKSKSPHFEQSFSDDGGKTWEVNWITDQTRPADAQDRQH